MLDAVDCAYPHPGQYPTQIVCGYVSGHTAHIWTDSEIAEVGQEGKTFLGIATARNASGEPPLTAQDGVTDARNMASRLTSIRYPLGFPNFYDIEPGIFDLDPTGARTAMASWKQTMALAGRPHSFDYTVLRQGGDWVADPTGIRPLTIPQGKIGEQWGGNGTFDFDVFADNILGGAVTTPTQWLDADKTVVENIVLAALNQGTGTGQLSWADTEKAILGTVQTLINEGRSGRSTIVADVQAIVPAVLGYLAAHPGTVTLSDTDKASIAAAVASQIESSTGLKVDPTGILDALDARLAS